MMIIIPENSHFNVVFGLRQRVGRVKKLLPNSQSTRGCAWPWRSLGDLPMGTASARPAPAAIAAGPAERR